LRHTFLRKLAETKGVHYAREASGHQSDCYIWRYVKPDQQTLAEAIIVDIAEHGDERAHMGLLVREDMWQYPLP
jgi:hypothetical protein